MADPLALASETQRAGDPQKGYSALVNNGYVSCGIPYATYAMFFSPAKPEEQIPGRDGHNANLPYWQTAFTTKSGVEVVSANCLTCHAGFINGKLVIGLGATDRDFTSDVSAQAELAGNFVKGDKDRAEWRKWADRVQAIGPYTTPLTVGVNPADNLAAVLFAHRDRKTLAWSNEPLMELPAQIVTPVKVPPWWRMKKKHVMFYDAAGKGDHARIMMTASTLCTDSVEEANAIDAYFPDVRAFIETLDAPKYPFAIDAQMAMSGRKVFESTCAGCHGTYGDAPTYPNRLTPLAVAGTDTQLAVGGGGQFAKRYVDWFNESFYGEKAKLVPGNGYVAPPLDGIWAAAPYLHNASVPTVAALLDSKARPAYWTRTFDSTDYDPDQLGFHFQPLDHGQAGEPDAAKRKLIYDTTQPGYGNGGHTFGDALSAVERRAVIEYLKTL